MVSPWASSSCVAAVAVSAEFWWKDKSFAFCAAASFFYVLRKVEETKGMELEQMDSVAEARLSQFTAVRAAKDKA